MATPFLSIVIPAFNEDPRIRGTLETVIGYLGIQRYSWEVLVADDGSTDATALEVQRFASEGATKGPVKLLALPHGGKGWAVRQGMLQAEGEYRFMCDADLSMPIEQLAHFLPPDRGGYDLAIGSREVAGARRIGEPRRRRLMARCFSLLVQGLALPGLADTQCGFKCFRASAAANLFARQQLCGFAFDVELLFLARKQGMHIVEVPIDWHYRTHSKVRPLQDSAAMTRDLIGIRWRSFRGRYNTGVAFDAHREPSGRG